MSNFHETLGANGIETILFVETRSPWESGDVRDVLPMLSALMDSGVKVHLHLIQNAVIWLLRDSDALRALLESSDNRFILTADDFSVQQRGISEAVCGLQMRLMPMTALVEKMACATVKTIWHS